jgi:O-acetyl-ADP-ribose deacetylase (regulator of RNase III)
MEATRVIRFVQGNLLDSDAEALVNTVNTQGVMGKGIALEFKRRFAENYDFYREKCKQGQVQIGKMLVFPTGSLQPQYIINFPTKQHWRGKSKIEYIQRGLEDLVRVVQEYGIRSIALPPLGCGHGGLRWEQVKPLIERAFAALPGVEVQVYEPREPSLAPHEAFLLHLIAVYSEMSPAPTQEELELLAEIALLQHGDALLPSKPKRRGSPAKRLVKQLIDASLLEKDKMDKTPIFGVALAQRREQARQVLEAHPDWQARVGQTLELIDGCDGLAALQAVSDVLRIRSNPICCRYFTAAWQAYREQMAGTITLDGQDPAHRGRQSGLRRARSGR